MKKFFNAFPCFLLTFFLVGNTFSLMVVEKGQEEKNEELLQKQWAEEDRIWKEVKILCKKGEIQKAIDEINKIQSLSRRDTLLHMVASVAVDELYDYNWALKIRSQIINSERKEYLARYIPLAVARYESKNVFIAIVEYMKIIIVAEFLDVPPDSVIIGEFYEGERGYSSYTPSKKLKRLRKISEIEIEDEKKNFYHDIIQENPFVLAMVDEFSNTIYRMGSTIFINRGMIDENIKIIQLIDKESFNYKAGIISGVIGIMNELKAPQSRDDYLGAFGYREKSQMQNMINYAGALRFGVAYVNPDAKRESVIIVLYNEDKEQNFLTLFFPSHEEGGYPGRCEESC